MKSIRLATFLIFLEIFSILYLTFPVIIFCLGFLKAFWAIPTVLTLSVALGYYLKASTKAIHTNSDSISKSISVSWISIITCFIVAILTTMLFGAGGWGFPTWDWHKHNAILTLLTQEEWPPLFNYAGSRLALVYYIAYYLPAALAGKMFGFFAANQVFFIYTFLGFFLSLLWVLSFSKRIALWTIIVFMLFSGMDILGALTYIISNVYDFPIMPIHHISSLADILKPGNGYDGFFFHLDSWAIKQISSIMTALAWIPQHGISSWLLTGLVLRHIHDKRVFQHSIFLLTIGMYWSIFTPLGLGAFMAFYFLITRNKLRNCRSLLSPENGFILPSLFIVMMYYHSHQVVQNIFSIRPFNILEYGLVLTVHILIIWLLVFFIDTLLKRKNSPLFTPSDRKVFFLTLLLPVIFLCFTSHDLPKNTCHPFVFMLAFAVIRTLESAAEIKKFKVSRYSFYVLILCLAIGAVTPIIEINRSLWFLIPSRKVYQPVQPSLLFDNKNITFYNYIGNTNTFFFRGIAKKY